MNSSLANHGSRLVRGVGRLRAQFLPYIGVAVFALAASGAPSVQADAIERQQPEVSIETLKRAYLACNRAAMQEQLTGRAIMTCSVIYEQLKQRAFGGDFDKLLAWSRANPTSQ